MSTRPARRRALDHLPWGANARPVPNAGPGAIEFHRGTGRDATAFPYPQLVWVNYFQRYGIIVHFGSHTVYVLGTDIEHVYHGIRDRTLKSVSPEADIGEAGTKGVDRVFIRQVGQNATGFVRPEPDTLAKEEA